MCSYSLSPSSLPSSSYTVTPSSFFRVPPLSSFLSSGSLPSVFLYPTLSCFILLHPQTPLCLPSFCLTASPLSLTSISQLAPLVYSASLPHALLYPLSDILLLGCLPSLFLCCTSALSSLCPLSTVTPICPYYGLSLAASMALSVIRDLALSCPVTLHVTFYFLIYLSFSL